LKACTAGLAPEAICAALRPEEIERLLFDWLIWARDDQLPPAPAQGAQDWTTWLILGGRGSGKTRAGAEWVRGIALGNPAFAPRPVSPIAIVGETLHDARSVMIEGLSGLLAIHPRHERPVLAASRREIEWPNGARAQFFSADDPESLRGPQFAAAWCDELCKWRYPEECWAMLQFGLRLGPSPKQAVTTTPRPVPLLKSLLADPRTAVSRARTADNAAFLAPSFLSSIVDRYAGTALGRQELDGELVEAREGALWTPELIESARVSAAPDLDRVVIGLDPAVSGRGSSDLCGIVCAGVAASGAAYVLEDASLRAATPLSWAQAAIVLFHKRKADCIVAEVNQGGDLVESLLRQVEPNVPVRKVHATRGKIARAEPVAALYEQGRVRHAAALPELEDEMMNFCPGELARGGRSPDRVDALVWALTSLMLENRAEPRIRFLS
jgi:phage terminase large subunit-like protein